MNYNKMAKKRFFLAEILNAESRICSVAVMIDDEGKYLFNESELAVKLLRRCNLTSRLSLLK